MTSSDKEQLQRVIDSLLTTYILQLTKTTVLQVKVGKAFGYYSNNSRAYFRILLTRHRW